MPRSTLPSICLLVIISLSLSACGRAAPDENELATQVAATVYADQTAEARAFTPTSTVTATSTPTPEPTTTSTLTPTPAPTTTPTLDPASDVIRLEADGSGDFPTLEEAVRRAPEGITLHLGPGTYRLAEPLDVRQSLRLVGAGMDQTEIVSEAEAYTVGINGADFFAAEDITFRHQGREVADVVVVQNAEIELARCRFTGAVYAEGEMDRAGLLLGGETSGVVRDCEAIENGNVGILVHDQAQPTLEHNLCKFNEGAGITYFDNAAGIARRNECSRNELTGIYVGGQAQPTLEENVCTGNEESGIAYFEDASGVALRNECSRNESAGIYVDDQAQPTLEENVCNNNGGSGIVYFEDAGGVARQNKVANNQMSGIYVGGRAQPTLEDNICTDNEDVGISYWENAGGLARENECSRNWSGIGANNQAQPVLEKNVCTDNEAYGIVFLENSGGVTRQNEASGNGVGIGIDENADPDLEDNDVYGNLEENILGLRPPQPSTIPTPTLTSEQTPIPAPTAPAVSAPTLGGKLAFSLPQGTQYKVYVVEVGPTSPAELYASVGNARQPALSHDGKWLLVNGTGGGIDAIARLTSEGHQITPVTCEATTAEAHRPIWSPDDRFLAFDGLGVDATNPQIYIHPLEEVDCDLIDNRLMIGEGMASDPNGLSPLWGPDDRIYFRSCATWDPQGAGDCGIWSAGREGGNLRQLTGNPGHIPTDVNQERLLFMTDNQGDWEIYSVGLEGGTPQNLSRHSGIDAWGTLSPDGRSIAFLSNRNGRWAIWLADVDGNNPREWLPINPDWGEVDPNRLGQERMSWSN
jgi:parallel beta-helix repeat protein